MKATAKIKCPGCSFTTNTSFKQPTAISVSCIAFVCESCKSTVSAQVRRGKDKSQIDYRCQVKVPSPFLLEMLREEAEHNKSDYAEYPEAVSNA